jgi:hypothetical protein
MKMEEEPFGRDRDTTKSKVSDIFPPHTHRNTKRNLWRNDGDIKWRHRGDEESGDEEVIREDGLPIGLRDGEGYANGDVLIERHQKHCGDGLADDVDLTRAACSNVRISSIKICGMWRYRWSEGTILEISTKPRLRPKKRKWFKINSIWAFTISLSKTDMHKAKHHEQNTKSSLNAKKKHAWKKIWMKHCPSTETRTRLLMRAAVGEVAGSCVVAPIITLQTRKENNHLRKHQEMERKREKRKENAKPVFPIKKAKGRIRNKSM